MSVRARGMRRLGMVLAGAGALACASLVPAGASSYEINSKVYCQVYEQVELQGSPEHDYMRWYTSGGSYHCIAEIVRIHDGSTSYPEERGITTTGEDNSAWYYDGPGYTMQVCVYQQDGDGQTGECGPWN